jgi:deoxycytidylate deaminase/dephospho-CoA kinase
MGSGTHIIGLTGSFGSGCSYIADTIFVPLGYQRRSLSGILREMFHRETGKDPNTVPRHELQVFGDTIRENNGTDFLAQELSKQIDHKNGKYVIESFRNPDEIDYFRKNFTDFWLLGIYASRDTRWSRCKGKDKYDGNEKAFNDDDANDKGHDNPRHGQRVEDCFFEADIVFANNEDFEVVGNSAFEAFKFRLGKYIDLVQNPLRKQSPIRPEESVMAMAYAISQRSSCLKRKVGAIIADEFGNLISSGFNEVPIGGTSCQEQYKACYRESTVNKYVEEIKGKYGIENPDEFKKVFKQYFRTLDICLALHAEENAIVNLARNGTNVPLDKCTLYSTTYPCRLCADKIVQVGIRKVIYLEPYPDPQAAIILRHGGVSAEPFEGVTFKAYFKLYGERK